jgi:hypothetical protein
VVITGLPGSGKTTLASELARLDARVPNVTRRLDDSKSDNPGAHEPVPAPSIAGGRTRFPKGNSGSTPKKRPTGISERRASQPFTTSDQDFCGGRYRARTDDLYGVNVALCQLS